MRFFNFFQSDSANSIGRRFMALVLVLGIGVFFTKTIIQLYQKSKILGVEREKQESKLRTLTLERERLENEIDFLKRNGTVEREAKARLNYKKDGERVVVVVPAEKSTAAVAESLPVEISFRERFFKLILRMFGL
ncbi:MAG: septum formation initiator family protein [Patescibacteria group bacterium]